MDDQIAVILDEESGQELLRERDTHTVRLAAATILNERKGLIETAADLLGLESYPVGPSY